jgi:hypothetical protein
MLMSWLDEGLYGTAAPLETHEESEVLQALSNDFLGWCDGDRWAGTDTVIFGKTLHDGKSYPVDDMEFWRELLGFPYVLDIE